MKNKHVRPLFLVGALIAVTCAAMAYSASGIGPHLSAVTRNGIVKLSGSLDQDKVISGGEGTVALALTLSADDVLDADQGNGGPVDLVIVLDRSGSMRGGKIGDAKQAALNLLSKLSEQDRLALVSYANDVQRHSNLLKVTAANRRLLASAIHGISANGGTNLGGGLQEGIDVLTGSRRDNRMGKVILISDGLANQGIKDPAALCRMASVAVEEAFGISTVGVGNEFNEQLMTAIADRGAGRYYYMEDPALFASVFRKELHNTRAVAATAVEVRVPLRNGMSLIDASGYPIEVKGHDAVFYPGHLLSGETRKIFLMLGIPTGQDAVYEIRGIQVRYCHNGSTYTAELDQTFRIACVTDQDEVFASIKKSEWEARVMKDAYNRLREEVAADIKKGNEKEALARIKDYADRQQSVNAVVGSSEVAGHLEKEVRGLRATVKQTFQGAPQEVEQKQKRNAKVLQYEGYAGRRSGN